MERRNEVDNGLGSAVYRALQGCDCGWSVRVPETSMVMSGLRSPVLVSVDDCYMLSDITHPSRIVTGNIMLRGNTGKCSVDSVIVTTTSCP